MASIRVEYSRRRKSKLPDKMPYGSSRKYFAIKPPNEKLNEWRKNKRDIGCLGALQKVLLMKVSSPAHRIQIQTEAFNYSFI